MIHSRLKNGYHRIPTYMHQSKMKRTEIDKKKICIVCSCRQSLQRLLVVSLVWPHLQHGKKSTLYLELQDLSRLAQGCTKSWSMVPKLKKHYCFALISPAFSLLVLDKIFTEKLDDWAVFPREHFCPDIIFFCQDASRWGLFFPRWGLLPWVLPTTSPTTSSLFSHYVPFGDMYVKRKHEHRG